MYQFHEDNLEQATLEWLENLGYETLNGTVLAHDGASPERDGYCSPTVKNIRLSTRFAEVGSRNSRETS